MVVFIFIPIGFDECEVEWVASNTQAALISGFPMAKAIVCDLFLSGEGVANNHGTSGFHGDLSCNNSLDKYSFDKKRKSIRFVVVASRGCRSGRLATRTRSENAGLRPHNSQRRLLAVSIILSRKADCDVAGCGYTKSRLASPGPL